jgi:hypothetical protein
MSIPNLEMTIFDEMLALRLDISWIDLIRIELSDPVPLGVYKVGLRFASDFVIFGFKTRLGRMDSLSAHSIPPLVCYELATDE